MIKVRFAPSPTGTLHIGGARTALFNWLYAKHHQGKCFLRIEDTDKERSTPEAVDAIYKSLDWLGLSFDGEVVIQSQRMSRHQEVAYQLLKDGKAYYCYCTPEELEMMREDAKKNNKRVGYNGFWRDRDPALAPKNIKPVIRLKMPQSGYTIISDMVQGDVQVNNEQLDDMILLRADGTPTYMLSVVVDDHDMDITHIIRGDDHLNNAFRQYQLYVACGWQVPKFGHIPLIHGADGAKMSKRHGATGTHVYKQLGILPEAMCNYLLRLGWGHGDDEIISQQQAIEWFDVDGIGRSPARFNIDKLLFLNAHYLKNTGNEELLNLLKPYLERHLNITPLFEKRLLQGMQGLKERSKTLVELSEAAKIYHQFPGLSEKADEKITPDTYMWIKKSLDVLLKDQFSIESLQNLLKQLAEKENVKMGIIAMSLRIAITGDTISPNLFEVMHILGYEEVCLRLKNFLDRNK